jgi:membrane protease YdiL (CAAX protease family)
VEGKIKTSHLTYVFFIYIFWLLIDYFLPYVNRLYDFRSINKWILPAVRMALMFLVTYLFVRFYEKKTFSSGFNFAFERFGKNILWAFVFFVIAGIVLMGYQFLIVKPLTKKVIEASGAISPGELKPFYERLIEYIYIVYEGIVEVFIFIGFLLDRLAKKWKWPVALVVGNVLFALWHYNYWRKGWLEGSLMVILTFLAGIIVSLSYVKTKNTLSPVICHTLVDSPSSIRILLGLM